MCLTRPGCLSKVTILDSRLELSIITGIFSTPVKKRVGLNLYSVHKRIPKPTKETVHLRLRKFILEIDQQLYQHLRPLLVRLPAIVLQTQQHLRPLLARIHGIVRYTFQQIRRIVERLYARDIQHIIEILLELE